MLRRIYILFFLVSLVLSSGPSDQPRCQYCGRAIQGQYLTYEGKAYHQNCFKEHIQPRCAYCGEPLEGSYTSIDGKSFHPNCYRDHILDKCAICSQPLEGRFLTDYWGNSYHDFHERLLHGCFSCGRLICDELTGGGRQIDANHFLCNICGETAVNNDILLDVYQATIRRLLEDKGVLGIPENIPLSLVDAKTLRKISKMSSKDLFGFSDLRGTTLNGRTIQKEAHIYILKDLPLVMFKATLAHELLHVYLFQKDIVLRSDIREGFCNLGSELIYQRDGSELSRYRLHNMQEDPDPDYGAGYRKLSAQIQKYGWSHVLQNLESL